MKKYLLIFVACFLALQAQAGGAKLASFSNKVPASYNFWLYTPSTYVDTVAVDSVTGESNSLPLVIFLHGKSLCGTDLSKVRSYGTLDALACGRTINALVLAPQNPGEWWNPEKIERLLSWVFDNYNVDHNRVYVLGMSLGGYGTMDFVGTYPEKVAAAIALCGGTTLKDFEQMSQAPLWIIHGTADKAVPVSASDKVVDALKKAKNGGLLTRYDRLAGVDHGSLARVFYMQETYDWLFKHSLADSVRFVSKDFELTVTALNKAYAGVNKQKSYFSVVSGGSTLASNASASSSSKPSSSNSNSNTDKKKDKTITYQVKKGDTLTSIAKKHGTTVDKICKANNLTSSSTIRIGQVLKIKK